MEKENLVVVNLDEIASRWQIPIDRIKYFITDLGMDPVHASDWVVDNWRIWLVEKQVSFDDVLFPLELRPKLAEPAPTQISLSSHVTREA
jgi:hypothetical protein